MRFEIAGVILPAAAPSEHRRHQQGQDVVMSTSDIDPRALLGTEARIVSEDRTHAVIAVRIEKRWLERNRRFIAHLVEMAFGGRDQH